MASSKTCQGKEKLAEIAVPFRDKFPYTGKILPQRF
tara:strand:+ start:497 stop:604 length:108 start_codon:yes stop_codon:yes gene_type:complete